MIKLKTFCKNILLKIKNLTKKQKIITISIISAVILIGVGLFFFMRWYNNRPKLNPYVGPPTPTITRIAGQEELIIDGVPQKIEHPAEPAKTEPAKTETKKTTPEKTTKKK